MGNLIKTDYGLIYNDDGSLCVTLREDDIPFPGVKAFAVEEGSTNEAAASTQSFVNISVTNLGNIGPNGTPAVLLTETTDTTAVSHELKYTNTATTTTYTISLYAKAAGRKIIEIGGIQMNASGWYPKFDLSTGAYVGNTPTGSYTIDYVGNGWYRITLTHTVTATGYPICVIMPNDDAGNRSYLGDGRDALYVAGIQVEAKPFATSFVDGTRTFGQMKLPVAKTENMVLAGWFKPTGVYSGTSATGEEARIINIEPIYSGDQLRFMYQKGTATVLGQPLQTFGIRTTQSGTDVATWTTKTYPPNQWYFWVFILDNGVYTAYIFDTDGTYETITHTVDMSTLTSDNILVGCRPATKFGTANGLIANLYIGDYRDNNGNIIWTDEYIQQVYKAKRPFAVPPRIPVI